MCLDKTIGLKNINLKYLGMGGFGIVFSVNVVNNETKSNTILSSNTNNRSNTILSSNINNRSNTKSSNNTLSNRSKQPKYILKKIKNYDEYTIINPLVVEYQYIPQINNELFGLFFNFLLTLYLKNNHPDNLKYICSIYQIGYINDSKSELYCIMENCGESLHTFFYNPTNRLILDQLLGTNKMKLFIFILQIILQCSIAIKILHDLEYVHFDIKLENLLIQFTDIDNFQIKLIDYGAVSKFRKGENKSTKKYSTELYQNFSPHPYKDEFKNDIFALGIIFIELLQKLIIGHDTGNYKIIDLISKPIQTIEGQLNNNHTEYIKTLLKNLSNALKQNLYKEKKYKEKYIQTTIIDNYMNHFINGFISQNKNKRYDNIDNLIEFLKEIIQNINNSISPLNYNN
jgi:serine/threonine protein kinase